MDVESRIVAGCLARGKRDNVLFTERKALSGSLSFGSAGYGTSQHLTGLMLEQATGIKLLHVPYKGSGPALAGLLGGQVDMVFDTMPTLMSQVGNEKLRFLAVTTEERTALLPKVPTMQEEGVKGFDVSTRYVLLAPKNTPEAIVQRMSVAMQKAGKLGSVRQSLANQGAQAQPTSPTDTDKALRDEVAIWSDVVGKAHLE